MTNRPTVAVCSRCSVLPCHFSISTFPPDKYPFCVSTVSTSPTARILSPPVLQYGKTRCEVRWDFSAPGSAWGVRWRTYIQISNALIASEKQPVYLSLCLSLFIYRPITSDPHHTTMPHATKEQSTSDGRIQSPSFPMEGNVWAPAAVE